ncbi:hypothetical protein [Legionella santicrucis]|uniref:hypothetical protein n=1 Tax=Legionella santicrucis TaxID=45074 RepID=UPI003B50B402
MKKTGYEVALSFFLEWQQKKLTELKIKAVGHRIVHGGNRFDSPVIITSSVEECVIAQQVRTLISKEK